MRTPHEDDANGATVLEVVDCARQPPTQRQQHLAGLCGRCDLGVIVCVCVCV